ncbi:MAG TPA: hypothetical protein DDY39_19750, partial [Nitrospira sp.]|nr:hypothetical protein [Nitrospira sp.]
MKSEHLQKGCRRSVNRKGTVGIILLAAITLAACGGPEERKAKYFARATEYMEAANYPKARVALRNVLKIDPKDADAYVLFARVEEKEKNWRNAVQLYQEAVRLSPDHTEALIALGKYYLEARLTDRVMEVAEAVLKGYPSHAQAQALKIASQVVSDEAVLPAIPKAEVLAREFPTEPDVAILLATLYGQRQRYREAEHALQRALAAYPQDLDLLNSLNTVLTRANDSAGAERVIRRMIEVEPESLDHRLRLAQFYVKHSAYGQAETV